VIGLTATSPAIFWRLEDPNSCVLSERSLIQVHPVCTISAVHDAHARNNALTALSLSLGRSGRHDELRCRPVYRPAATGRFSKLVHNSLLHVINPCSQPPFTRQSLTAFSSPLNHQLLLLHRPPPGLLQRCWSVRELLPRNALRHQHDCIRDSFFSASTVPLPGPLPLLAFPPPPQHRPFR
jgi:hypothetical protein